MADFRYTPPGRDKTDTNVSRAGPGVGVKDPEDVTNYRVRASGEQTGLIIRWDGNGYDRDSCWIRADMDSVLSLEENE